MENKNKDYEWILKVHALNFIRNSLDNSIYLQFIS